MEVSQFHSLDILFYLMDKIEAKSILDKELSNYRKRSYEELLRLVDNSHTTERIASSGKTYQIEIEVLVDDEALKTLRVSGAIDDGGWRAFVPQCDDFIIAPDGSFIGE